MLQTTEIYIVWYLLGKKATCIVVNEKLSVQLCKHSK
jgi:hypothetical protein